MNHKTLCLIALLATLAILTAGPAVAEGGGVELQVTVEAFQETTSPEGETVLTLVPAETVVPGDEVLYSIRYVNRGDESADNVVITNEVPEHLLFNAQSAEHPQAVTLVSIDGGRSYHNPATLWVLEPDGSKRRAAVTDYTHIQWALQEPLQPGQAGAVSYRARLE